MYMNLLKKNMCERKVLIDINSILYMNLFAILYVNNING